jgi:hypothetical protein
MHHYLARQYGDAARLLRIFFFARNILELVFGFIFLSQMTVLVATRGGLDTSTGIAIALK